MKSFIELVLIYCLFSTGLYASQTSSDKSIYQKKTEIPVVKNVDIMVVGGTTSAVSAAVSAAMNGALVVLVTSRPYLGEDICATLKLDYEQKTIYNTEIEKVLFSGEGRMLTPLEVKSKLIDQLAQNNIDILFSSYPTDVLKTDKQEIIGLVIGNRAGRQIITTKAIIDATNRATICRIAGSPAMQWKGDKYPFTRNLIKTVNNDTIIERQNLLMSLKDFSFQSLSDAEQKARDYTYSSDLVRGAESLDFISPDPIQCKKASKDYNGFNIGHYQSAISDFLFVLSTCADIPRDTACALNNETGEMMLIGRKIGEYASEAVKNHKIVGKYKGQTFSEIKIPDNKSLNVCETGTGLRPIDKPQKTMTIAENAIPVLAEYDVVVVGGGTSGAPAAIAASKQGCKVLVIEYLEGLGGMGTLGMIGNPYHGKKTGFAASVPFPDQKGSIETKMEWYRKELRKTETDIWTGAMSCGSIKKDNTVAGVVVLTSDGRGAVLAKVVIDATGNADVAISAGASYMYGDIEKGGIALQGSGLPSRELFGTFYNTDYLLVDETDMIDISNTIQSVHTVKAKEKAFDVGSLVHNREHRRIIGDVILRYEEQIAGRNYPDLIVRSMSDYDSHGYPSSLFFALLIHDSVSIKKNHPAPGGNCYTPYRSLLPKGLDNILVAGIAISMDRDVTALMRMQYDIANQGYTVGYAASLAVKKQIPVRDIPVSEVQMHLVSIGNLNKEDIPEKDNFPYSEEEIKKAVEDFGKSVDPESCSRPLAIIFTHADKAIPIITEKYKNAPGDVKLKYAKVLSIFGRKDGIDLLKKEFALHKEWDNKIFQGNMACYAHLPTEIDALILSLAYSGDKTVLPLIIERLKMLNKDVTLSHHLSLAKALEKMGDKKACKPLAELLEKKGMGGYAIHTAEELQKTVVNDGKKQQWRTWALREIILASTLYKCGDYNNIGRNILKQYQTDVRGLLARHADYILSNFIPVKPNPLD
jgi:thioredoxin reductase